MAQLMVLGIDDDGQARHLIAVATRRLGQKLGQPVSAHVTHSAKEAIELLHERGRSSETLVVLDLNLPGDVDGRLLGSYIREHFPEILVLPFTGDDRPEMMHIIQLNGLHEPVLRPTSVEELANRMAATLTAQTPECDTLLQAFHADIAEQMSSMVRPVDAGQAVRVALLARKHVVLAGLKQILTEVGDGVTVTVPSGRPDPVIVAARQGQVDLLICDPDDLDDACEIAQGHGIPVLVYASLCNARLALARGQNVVVEPLTRAGWLEAMQAVLRGERYRPRHLEALLALSSRDRAIVKLLRRGMNSAQIGNRIGVTGDRVRQRMCALYRQLGLEPRRSDLQAWAQELPEEWLDELADEAESRKT